MFRKISLVLLATLAVFALSACDDDEIARLQKENTQLIQVSSDTTSRNKEMTASVAKLNKDLATEKNTVSGLEKRLAAEREAKLHERNAKAVARIELNGAKKVAGTAVDHAHAKGVKDGIKIAKK
jgi:uncharacterized lipoprotein YehR (DUF1307 family)